VCARSEVAVKRLLPSLPCLALLAAACGPTTTSFSRPPPGGGDDGGGGPGADLAVPPAGADLTMGSNDDLTVTVAPSFADHCNGKSTTLSGTAYAPNGVDPVSNALVYVSPSVKALPTGPYCDHCSDVIANYPSAGLGNAQGVFTITLDTLPWGTTVKLVVTKGRFRRITSVNVTCGANTAPPQATTLPGKSADGDIPKIAVGTGTRDHLDQVLVALGITEFTCLEGRKNTTSAATCTTTGQLSDLLTNQNGLSIDDYQIIFIGCAPGAYANYGTIGVSTATINQNLQAWTAKGGRLFVTDNSYDYVAQAFPQPLSWQGPAGAVDGANLGVGGTTSSPATYNATVDDAKLAAWLKVVGVGTSPMVSISGFLNNWSVLASPVPAGTRQIADGTVTFTVNGAMMMADEPLTADFQVNSCGKVTYSSYHTLSTVNQASLSPQEKIVEYLMLESAACL
jgi:hypothetical protein